MGEVIASTTVKWGKLSLSLSPFFLLALNILQSKVFNGSMAVPGGERITTMKDPEGCSPYKDTALSAAWCH